MEQAAEFFNWLLNAPVSKVCVENPVPHRHARAIIGQYTQLIHPWQFGHSETKRTGLWLRGLPKLKPTNVVDKGTQRIYMMPDSKGRADRRSITYQGIADAMAEQWPG